MVDHANGRLQQESPRPKIDRNEQIVWIEEADFEVGLFPFKFTTACHVSDEERRSKKGAN